MCQATTADGRSCIAPDDRTHHGRDHRAPVPDRPGWTTFWLATPQERARWEEMWQAWLDTVLQATS